MMHATLMKTCVAIIRDTNVSITRLVLSDDKSGQTD